jgi:hypothetical protein
MPIIVFSIVLAVVIMILIVSFVLFYKDHKKAKMAPTVVSKMNRSKSLEECTIEEITARIDTEDLSEVELLKVVALVAQKHKFPSKNSDKSADKYLEFVLKFCLNKNSDGATIVKMSNTLKAINKAYKNEIEQTERDAIKLRDTAKK